MAKRKCKSINPLYRIGSLLGYKNLVTNYTETLDVKYIKKRGRAVFYSEDGNLYISEHKLFLILPF